MELIQSVFALLLPLAFGFLVWELAQPGNSRNHLESLGFSFPIGMGAVSILLLVMANLRISFNRTVLISLMIIVIAALAIIRIRTTSTLPASDIKSVIGIDSAKKWIQRIFAAIIAIELLFLSAELFKYPGISEWDGWAIWAIKAKAFFIDRGFDHYLSHSAEYGFSWPARPCISSIFQTFLYFVSGNVNEALARAAHLFGFASLLALFYTTLRRRLSPHISTVWTAVLATVPNLTHQAASGLGNVPLAIFLFASLSALDRWRLESRKVHFVIAAALMGCALLARDEAAGLCMLFVASFLIFTKCPDFISRRNLIALALLFVIIAAALFALWPMQVRAHKVFDLRTAWITPELFQRMKDHLHDLKPVYTMIRREYGKPSEQTQATPVETILKLALFWPIFAASLLCSLSMKLASLLRSKNKNSKLEHCRQDPLAIGCSLFASLGLLAYAAGLWLFPYSALEDLKSWVFVLDRHVLSILPIAACAIALTFSRCDSPR
jgi:hypothetical protein